MNPAMMFLKERLRDERSNKVVFLSHCILNENLRYLGGAFTKGMIPEIVHEIERQGYGIVQMPCPEQHAWGGVRKNLLWLPFGIKGTLLYSLRFILLPLFQLYTRMTYRNMARMISLQIKDYIDSGFTVIGITGIDGSPSCGINKYLDLKKSFYLLSSLTKETLDRNEMNKRFYGECLFNGKGLFINELERALRKKNISVPFLAHDLVREAQLKKPASPSCNKGQDEAKPPDGCEILLMDD